MSYKPRHAKASSLRRTVTAVATTAVAAASLAVATPAVASAQEQPAAGSSSFDLGQALADISKQTRDNAWNTRNQWIKQAEETLPAPQAAQAKQAIDATINTFFPGLIQERLAAIAAAERAAREAAERKAREERERRAAEQRAAAERERAAAERARNNISACPAAAKACVDIAGGRSWIQQNGRLVHMAPSSAAMPGYDTPKGWHRVTRKVKDEVSYIYGNAPMPNSVYFTNNGHAFHAGAVGVLSHGCIHLNYNDSVVFFNNLQVGDSVYIY